MWVHSKEGNLLSAWPKLFIIASNSAAEWATVEVFDIVTSDERTS